MALPANDVSMSLRRFRAWERECRRERRGVAGSGVARRYALVVSPNEEREGLEREGRLALDGTRDTHDDSVARSRVSSMSSSSELADDTRVMDAVGSIFDGRSHVDAVEEMAVRSTSLGGERGLGFKPFDRSRDDCGS